MLGDSMSRHSVPCVLLPCDSEALQVPQQRSNPSSARAHTRAHSHAFAEDVCSSRDCKSECEWASARSPERPITLSKLCTHDLVSKSARHRRPSRSRSVIAASRTCTPAGGRRTACAAREQASQRWAGGQARLGCKGCDASGRKARRHTRSAASRTAVSSYASKLGTTSSVIHANTETTSSDGAERGAWLRGACERAVQCSAVQCSAVQ
jgi:hypothetical protein